MANDLYYALAQWQIDPRIQWKYDKDTATLAMKNQRHFLNIQAFKRGIKHLTIKEMYLNDNYLCGFIDWEKDMPENIRVAVITNAHGLINHNNRSSLSELPRTLEVLNLNACTSLNFKDDWNLLPPKLRELRIIGVGILNNKINFNQLPDSLKTIEVSSSLYENSRPLPEEWVGIYRVTDVNSYQRFPEFAQGVLNRDSLQLRRQTKKPTEKTISL